MGDFSTEGKDFYTCLRGLVLHDSWKVQNETMVLLYPRHLRRIHESARDLDLRCSFKSKDVDTLICFKADPPRGGFGSAPPDVEATTQKHPATTSKYAAMPPKYAPTMPKYAPTMPKHAATTPMFHPPKSKHPPPEPAHRAPPQRGADGFFRADASRSSVRAVSPDAKAPEKPKLRSPQRSAQNSQKLPTVPSKPPRGSVGAVSPDAKAPEKPKLRSPQRPPQMSQKLQTVPSKPPRGSVGAVSLKRKGDKQMELGQKAQRTSSRPADDVKDTKKREYVGPGSRVGV
jgi:hypothetical protein